MGLENNQPHFDHTDYENASEYTRNYCIPDEGIHLADAESRERLLNSSLRTKLGELATKDLGQDEALTKISRKELKALAEFDKNYFDTKRERTSYQTKYDVGLAFRVIFDYYAQIGSGYGYEQATGERKTLKRSSFCQAAEVFLINFSNAIMKKAPKELIYENYCSEVETKNLQKRDFDRIILDVLKLKDVDWLGSNWECYYYAPEELQRLRSVLDNKFSTKKEYNPADGSYVNSYQKDRQCYLNQIDEIIADERREYNRGIK